MKEIYLLDTNAISELLKLNPNSTFIKRFCENEKRCAISSTAWNELIYGLNMMPDGKRKDFLFSKIVDDIQAAFSIIQFDNHAAWIQADLRSRLKNAGITVDYADTEIAAIAISNQMVLVTRNTKHFEQICKVDSVFCYENWFEE